MMLSNVTERLRCDEPSPDHHPTTASFCSDYRIFRVKRHLLAGRQLMFVLPESGAWGGDMRVSSTSASFARRIAEAVAVS